MTTPKLSDHDLISMALDRVHEWLCKQPRGDSDNSEGPTVESARDAEQMIFLVINLNAEMGDEATEEPLENLTWTNGRLASEIAQRVMERIKAQQQKEDRDDEHQD